MRQAGGRPGRWDVPLIVAGCAVMALSFRLFLNGNGLVAGGIVGVSTILEKSLGWEPAYFQWGVNIPLLALGFLVLGRAVGVRSLLGSFVLPLAVLVTAKLPVLTHDPLLAALFGGSLYGLGLGMVLVGRGSVGGYSLVAPMVVKLVPASVPAVILVFDACTILSGAAVFPFDKVLLGILSAVLVRVAADRVLVGLTPSMAAFIVSAEPTELKRRVTEEMDRGSTVLPAQGGYTGEAKHVLMVAVTKAEVGWLRQLVREADPDAFMVVTEAAEVRGKGFRRD